MDIAELLVELYGRVPPLAAGAVDGLSADQLQEASAPATNSIGWLIWHLTRVQDHHIAELLDQPQLWVEGGWAPQFGLEPDPSNTGYGHTAAQVAAVRPESTAVLLGYLDVVNQRTRRFLETLTSADLDRVIDRRWDPPVTLGVRLVSVADDCLQHAGQAAYLRGVIA